MMATITLSATDDNFVYSSSGSRDTNYDSEATQIYVKNASTDRIGFIKFNLSPVLGSVNTAENATLDLTFKNASSAGSGDSATFTIYALSNTAASNANWTEGGVTYNSRPDGTFTSIGTYDWSYNASDVPVSITFSDIADYIQTDDTITFRILATTQGDTSNNFYWHSSEAETAAYQPSLTLVPEPSAAAMLMGLAVLSLVSRRRRK